MDKRQVNYLLRAGYIYEWVGDLQSAQAYYQLAIENDPNNTNAINGLQRVIEE